MTPFEFFLRIDPRLKYNFRKEEYIELAIERSTYDFMKQHEEYFDESLSKRARNEACGLKPDAGMTKSKIVNGRMGHGKKTLSEALQDRIHQKWMSVVEPVTGCSSYDELRKQFKGKAAGMR